MERGELRVGETYTYYPPKERVEDNVHYPAEVLEIGRRMIKVRLAGLELKKNVRYVGAKRLLPQTELEL